MTHNGTVVSLLLAVLGVGLTSVGAWHAYERESQAMLDELETDLDDRFRLLEREIELNLEALVSLKALHDVLPAIDLHQFGVFARQAIARHPGIQALEWAPRVTAGERLQHEERARQDGLADYRISESSESGRSVPAGSRAEYFPVYFVEPLEGNEQAQGYDLASDPVRRQALERSRATGSLQATAAVKLVQDPSEQSGFLVYLPTHRGEVTPATLDGFVVGVYRIPDIFEVALGDGGDGLVLTLVDTAAGDRVIYRHAGVEDAATVEAPERRRKLPVAGQDWAVKATPSHEYLSARRSWLPQIGFVVGLLLTAMLVAYVRVSSSRARAVEDLVEMRTRDLRDANERLERQRQLLQSILDHLGDGVAVTDEAGTLTMFNPAAERILGLGLMAAGPDEWGQVYGLFQPDMTTPVSADQLPLARAVAGETTRDVELFVRNPERPGGVFILVTATPLGHAEAGSKGAVAVFRDIGERKWAEAVLRDSEARFRAIVEATSSALIILSPRFHIREFNPQAERLFGAGRAKALGQDFVETYLPAAFRESASENIRRVLAGERTQTLEIPVPSGEAGEHTLLWSFSRLVESEDREAVVIATGHDITERRQAEAASRVRELANRLQSAREAERSHVAREIHDELGQALTGLKFEVSYLSRQVARENPELGERIERVASMIDGTIVSVRRIATNLRPLILDELGLFDAILWLVKQFEERTRIPCAVELPESQPDWSRDRATAVFRILQEALTNIARHSEATRAEVSVSLEDGRVVLEVRDDGRGITADQAGAWESFGLLGMQERAAMFGGALAIGPGDPHGTTVTVTMPY
jgi:PAS domain S-box-containing protein